MRFWDSSALVALLVEQAASARAERWAREDPQIVVWTLTRVEAVSALRRLVREDVLPERAAGEAEDLLDALLEQTHAIEDVPGVRDLACRLLRTHPLRAADAMQLGAALVWANGHPKGLVVHTLDGRLALAARREGFHLALEPP